VGSKHSESLFFEYPDDTRQQMAVAAAEQSIEARQQKHGKDVRPKVSERGPDDTADEYQVVTARTPRQAAHGADLTDCNPVMRIARNPRRVGRSAQRQQHNTAPTLLGGIRYGERQASPATNDGERVVGQ
jgi:hypothetical protein